MRKSLRWILPLTILALGDLTVGAAVSRADDKLVPEEGAIEVMLLRQPSVREDLKLSHDEASKIDNFTREQWEKAKEISKLSTEAERDKKFAEMSKENDRFVDKTLTKEQRQRLKEIEFQIAGLICLNRPEVAKKLNLTVEQSKRVKEMQKQIRQEMEELLYNSAPESRQAKADEIRKTSRAGILELLNDEQEKTWAQLQGRVFKGEIVFGKGKSAASN